MARNCRIPLERFRFDKGRGVNYHITKQQPVTCTALDFRRISYVHTRLA